jgi:hypothetical protein
MGEYTKRSTIYFEPELHKALRLKAAHANKSVSEIVNDAVRESLKEDYEDMAAFEQRVHEPLMTYEELLNDLRLHGKI